MLQPMWWTGRMPMLQESFTIDCSKLNLSGGKPSAELEQTMKDTYERHGVVLLTNTSLSDLETMNQVKSVVMGNCLYEGGANSRETLGAAVYDTGAPKEAHLHYHHEMAYVRPLVKNLGFLCNAATEGTGYMYLSDNLIATDEIMKTEVGRKLKEKGICYIRCLTDKEAYKNSEKNTFLGKDELGVYNHWQTSFMTEDPAKVEQIAQEKGLEVHWGDQRYLKTKFYTDAFEYFPQLDRNLLFASVADDSMWFDNWPGVMHLPTLKSFETASMNERPLKITYGDDTEFTREELFDFMRVYDHGGFPIRWKVGDILVFCNVRYAHGRPDYTLLPGEGRKLGVTLGAQIQRQFQNNNAWC